MASGRLPSEAVLGSDSAGFVVVVVVARINRWRSSPPALSSLSESKPSSNVSASVRSASDLSGSEERRCRDVGEEARERKEGGGEEGIGYGEGASVGSSEDIWGEMKLANCL